MVWLTQGVNVQWRFLLLVQVESLEHICVLLFEIVFLFLLRVFHLYSRYMYSSPNNGVGERSSDDGCPNLWSGWVFSYRESCSKHPKD